MANAVFVPPACWMSAAVIVPESRGPLRPDGGAIVGKQRLPDDSIGNCLVTMLNVVVGSVYRFEVASTGQLITQGTATQSNFTVNVPYYQAGNSNNNVRIKIRKGTSSPFYIPYETQMVAQAAPQTIYVSQIPDE